MRQGFMKPTRSAAIVVFAYLSFGAAAQINVPLPGRSVNKLLPDYLRPRVYALNRASGSVPGTLLALSSTNGAILNEISYQSGHERASQVLPAAKVTAVHKPQ